MSIDLSSTRRGDEVEDNEGVEDGLADDEETDLADKRSVAREDFDWVEAKDAAPNSLDMSSTCD